MWRLGFLLILLSWPARAQVEQSPAFEQLQGVEGQNPESAPTPESSKEKSGFGFLTVKTLHPIGSVSPQGEQEPQPSSTVVVPQMPGEDKQDAPVQKPAMVFKLTESMKGIKIGTAQEDPTGQGETTTEKLKNPVKKWWVNASLGLGAALTIAGLFFSPLLFLGGLLLGAGLVLMVARNKLKDQLGTD